MAGPAKADNRQAGAVIVPLRKARKCPICGKDSMRAYYPFDAKRCADIDLNRWLSGSYAIPAVEQEPVGQAEEGEDGKE